MSNSPLLISPHLQIATICERHILEADGVLTLFRVFDRFIVTGTSEEMPTTSLHFTVVVVFRSGHFRGKLDLELATLAPSMSTASTFKIPVLFEGDDERASNVFAQVQMVVKEEGLYWVTVRLAGEERTRIPLRIAYQKSPMVTTAG